MKRALIEIATNRFCQVAAKDFPVSETALRWIDCADDVAPETHDFDGQNFVAKPPPPPKPTADENEASAIAFLNGGNNQFQVDWRKLFLAKAISDEAFRLGVAPGALTGPQLANLRARIAAIYKAL